MLDLEIVHKELYKDKMIVVVRRSSPYIGQWHNGYIETIGEPDDDELAGKIETDEITYVGHILSDEKWFIGFDSAHSWNDQEPESKSATSVLERAKKIADELIIIERETELNV